MRDFHLPGRSAVFATNGICATSHPLAAGVALQILRDGGNAVDAAIAGAVLLGICEPHMTGIGGDCFALVHTPDGKIAALNGSGRAPEALDPEAIRQEIGEGVAIPPRSAHGVTIPGAIDAFCQLSERHGRLGLERCLAPAIAYAEEGVPVAPRVAFDWANAAATLGPDARRHYLYDGAPPSVGQMFRHPPQAEVLRRIAREGRAAFYEGEVAEDIVAALTALGGSHAIEDFARNAPTDVDPIAGRYRDVEIVEHPPNGQGVIALLITRILAHFDLAAMDPRGAARAHLEAEATRLAYDARDRLLGDAADAHALDRLTSPDLAEALAGLVRPDRAIAEVRATTEAVHRDTIYITVVDRDRMAVSLIYSLFSSFGSGIASPKFGILLQNRGTGFNLIPGHPNEARPGRRPIHTIIPAMLRRDGKVAMSFGVMGGPYQPQGHAHFVSNLVDFGMDPQAAIDAPRIYADGAALKVERGYPDEVRQALRDLGHNVVVPEAPVGGAQAIAIHENGVLEGASDPRKDGCAIGY